ANNQSLRTRTISAQQLSPGQVVKILGEASNPAGEWARVDYIEFIPVGDTPPPTPNPGVIAFSANNFSLSENGTPVQEVTLNRTGGTQGQVSVTLTPTNGTATNADYDDNPIVVTFADGETSKTVEISVVDDSEVEGNETINLDLSNPTGGVTIGNSDSATLTIVDNDTPPPAPGETITLEAENLNLTNYRLESNSVASGGELITLLGSGSDTGTATAHFNGASGTYNVEITFFDENDGEGNLAVNIGSNQASLLLNDNLGSGGVTNNNKVTTQIFSNVEISNGELITITGNAEAAEWARVDQIKFIPVGDTPAENPTEGNDFLQGNSEDNTINALGGDDIIKAGAGNNNIDGGSGSDTISYNYKTAGVNVDLNAGIATRKFTTTEDTEYKILALGDSNTRGYPRNSNIGGYRTELWRNLAENDGFNLDFVGQAKSGPSDIDRDHEGRGGLTIDELTDNVNGTKGFNSPTAPLYTNIEDVLATNGNPDMVLVMAGTNDILQGDTVDNAISEYTTLIDRITIASPDTQVLVGSLIPNLSNSERQAKTIEFSGRVEAEVVNPLANQGKNVAFVDIFNAPLGISDFSSDLIHLKQSGYDDLADVWYQAITNTESGEDTLTNIENIVGSAFNDVLKGDNNANIIDGGKGDDLFTGLG
ncbi:MAG: hypothetical protein F6J89_19840, partial [Symploca sp. SIO1C4]|nr:hypothetical protein [Symploca sp. SIO1C4]